MFKDKLRELRINKGLTQEELAEKIFVSRSAICKWELGNGIPSQANVDALCDFFDIKEEWLLDREDLKRCIANFININTKINLTSLIGIFLSIALFLLTFVGYIETMYASPNGDAAIMPMIITSIAFLLKLKIIPFLLIYFLLLVISIINLVKITREDYKKGLLILNLLLIIISVLIFIISYVIAINTFINL